MKKEQPTKEDYDSDILDLQRKILKGVQIKNVKYLEILSGQDRIEFLRYCSEMVGSKWFPLIFPELFFAQLLASANAENYDEVCFHRATINGIKLVKDFFEKYERQYKEEFEKEESKHDPNKAFESVSSEQFYK